MGDTIPDGTTHRARRMSKGFTIIEMVITCIVVSVIAGFTFSVIWQYSKIYGDTRGGFIYGEGAALLERISRELKDASEVYVDPFATSNPALHITFKLTNGTPADTAAPLNQVPPYWVQYCICSAGGPSRAYLYRVILSSYTDGNQCASGCPDPSQRPVILMSSNIMSSHSNQVAESRQGFQVRYLPGDAGTEDDSFEIALALAADRTQRNPLDDPVYPRNLDWNDLAGVQYTNNISTVMVSRVTPRNYDPAPTGRAFRGFYYDQIY
jgi:prepilin-type N-terminal cleavage/methylation domain-containing protein